MTGKLAGRTILVPESRELDLFAAMLEAKGATVERCPLVTILDLGDTREIKAWLTRLIVSGFDDLILLTGEGLRRLLMVAEGADLKTDAVAAIGRTRTIIRGPKPARALREIGLSPSLSVPVPTTDGVIAALKPFDLKGRRVGVQLYPDNAHLPLLNFLENAGAVADPITPYRYASNAETNAVETVIRRMADGNIDLVAFTSTPQIRRLSEVATDRNLMAELKAGLARTRVAAVGPVVVAALAEIGTKATVVPEASFHLKPFVNAIVASFEQPQ